MEDVRKQSARTLLLTHQRGTKAARDAGADMGDCDPGCCRCAEVQLRDFSCPYLAASYQRFVNGSWKMRSPKKCASTWMLAPSSICRLVRQQNRRARQHCGSSAILC